MDPLLEADIEYPFEDSQVEVGWQNPNAEAPLRL
jgi:hypothetical protein